jgi:hypothetical protein
MDASDFTAARRGFLNRPLVLVALMACAGISLSAGDANAGLSPGQSCAVKKLKEAAKVVGTMLKCVIPPGPPEFQGYPPGPCIQAAGARLTEAFVKLEAKGGCVSTDDAESIQVTLEDLVAKLSVLVPSDPPCAVPGQACGSCAGGGMCEPALPSGQNRNVCIDEGAIRGHTCSLTMCASDADCPKGEACFQPSGTTTQVPPVCCTGCTGCNDNDPCTQDLEAGLLCAHTPAPDGTPCDDGTVCNGHETCAQGICTVGPPLSCDDSNHCTTDKCHAFTGCEHTNLPPTTPCLLDNGGSGHCQDGKCE